MKWILFWFLTGCLLCGIMGCRTDNSMKIITDIDQRGDVTWHTEYEVKW